MTLDPRLQSILACPKCHGPLLLKETELSCANCAVAYSIVDAIPVLVERKATEKKEKV